MRAHSLLEAIAVAPRPPTAAELAREVGLHLSTTHHLLATLADLGMVRKVDGRRYRLGSSLRRLAAKASWDILDLDEVMAEIDALHGQTRETTYLGTWEGDEIVVAVVRLGTVPIVVGGLGVGQRQDVQGATAKAILAFSRPERVARYVARVGSAPKRRALAAELRDVRTKRYAFDVGSFDEAVACLSAPVLAADEIALGAISIAVPRVRFEQAGPWLLEVVTAAGDRASRSLGYAPDQAK